MIYASIIPEAITSVFVINYISTWRYLINQKFQLARKHLRAQNTRLLNRHQQREKHPSAIRRCSQTTANLTAGTAAQLKWEQHYSQNSYRPGYP